MLIISATLVAVAVPEGLPLAVTLTLAFATKRMIAKKLLVRTLGSCETMANASVVCTGKTGTLTQNVMSVIAGSIRTHAKFVRNLKGSKAHMNTPDREQGQKPQGEDIAGVAGGLPTDRKHAGDLSIERGDINTILSPQLERPPNQSILTINSTAFKDIDQTKELAFVGSKMETALLQFAKDPGWEDWKQTREPVGVVQVVPFSSERKATGVVFRLYTGSHHLFLEGALEILTKQFTHHATISRNTDWSQCADPKIKTKAIDEIAGDDISRTIIFHADQMLRTIVLCYRDFRSWPPAESDFQSDDEVPYKYPPRDLNPVAIAGTEHPQVSMGIAGTEIAKEASDVVLVGSHFALIFEAIMRGWCVDDAVHKFLQFQILTNITTVTITLISTVA